MATSTSPAFSSVRPAPCTCQAARCSTRWKAAVCSGSRSPVAGLQGPVEVVLELLLQVGEVGAAGHQDLGGDLVPGHGVEQVLQRDVLVRRAPGVGHRALEGCCSSLDTVTIAPLLRLDRTEEGILGLAGQFHDLARPWSRRSRRETPRPHPRRDGGWRA